MASYFDEHDCVPLGENERPIDYLHLARLLVDSGIATAMGLDYSNLNPSASNLAPPVSQKWLTDEFPKYRFDESERAGFQCPICLVKFVQASSDNQVEGSAVRLSRCGHTFHSECLLRWLKHTNSCPMCREEYPTDDPRYEEFKRQKKREKEREKELADLHDSMFS